MGSLKINCPKCAKRTMKPTQKMCKKCYGVGFFGMKNGSVALWLSIILSVVVSICLVALFEHEWRLNRNDREFSAAFDRELKRHFPNRVDIAGIDKTVLLRELCGNTAICTFTATDLLGDSVDPRIYSYGKNRFESVVKKIKE